MARRESEGDSVTENAEQKGRRLLTEGRLTILRVIPELDTYVAECKGDSGANYRLVYDPRFKKWSCSCPALGQRCSHLVAVKLCLVVAV
jgi:uncharacterized Zn finger protein